MVRRRIAMKGAFQLPRHFNSYTPLICWSPFGKVIKIRVTCGNHPCLVCARYLPIPSPFSSPVVVTYHHPQRFCRVCIFADTYCLDFYPFLCLDQARSPNEVMTVIRATISRPTTGGFFRPLTCHYTQTITTSFCMLNRSRRGVV